MIHQLAFPNSLIAPVKGEGVEKLLIRIEIANFTLPTILQITITFWNIFTSLFPIVINSKPC